MAAYGRYRAARSSATPTNNFETAQAQRFIPREERSWLKTCHAQRSAARGAMTPARTNLYWPAGRLVADPARSRMLAYLLTGEYASASELAKAASVAPATLTAGTWAAAGRWLYRGLRTPGRHPLLPGLADARVARWRRWPWWLNDVRTTARGSTRTASACVSPAAATGTGGAAGVFSGEALQCGERLRPAPGGCMS